MIIAIWSMGRVQDSHEVEIRQWAPVKLKRYCLIYYPEGGGAKSEISI